MELFVALTSADGYKKLTSHLGPDPQVRVYLLKHSCLILNISKLCIGEELVLGHGGT